MNAKDIRGWEQSVFEPKPDQWGLRGDPFLWEDLREALSFVERPDSPGAFEAMIMNAIEMLLGCPLDPDMNLFVERFARGGMSSGYISGSWWIGNGIPELIRRFSDMSVA